MRNAKKWLGLISCSLLFGLAVPTVCFAREKIEEISLSFSADLGSDAEWPDMEISGDDEGYSVDDFQFQPDSSKKYPEGVVTLLADDDHYFGNIKASNCDLEGEGAVFVKAVKKTSSQLNLTISFHEMGVDMLDNPTGLTWGQNGYASWNPTSGAKHYEVRLMRDGKSVITQSAETVDPSYDFSSFMVQPGSYYFRVRGISRYHSSTASEWVDSPILNVESDGKTDEAASQSRPNTPGRWILENGAWYWENPDSLRASLQWVYYNDGWYYFHENTSMASGWNWIAGADGVKRCYFFHPGPDGTMGKLYTNSVTPDGSSVNNDGAWIVNGVVQTQ